METIKDAQIGKASARLLQVSKKDTCNRNSSLYEKYITNMIAWAKKHLGSEEYARRCLDLQKSK